MGLLDARVVVDPAEVQRFVRNPDGPIARRMMIVAEAVRQETIASLKEGFVADYLGPTIVKRTAETDEGLRIVVGSEHTRTQPHVINGNPLLVFFSPKAGRTLFVRSVNHPGSDFRNYLLERLSNALRVVKGV